MILRRLKTVDNQQLGHQRFDSWSSWCVLDISLMGVKHYRPVGVTPDEEFKKRKDATYRLRLSFDIARS